MTRSGGTGVALADYGSGAGACLTRFVLPFAYRLDGPVKPGPGAPQFRPMTALEQEHERRVYLTPETTIALFDRARWFRLDGADGQPAASAYPVTTPDGRTLGVCLAAPVVVLFEAGSTRRRRDRSPDPDLLRTGLLIQDARLTGAPGVLFLEDLLAFNETYRYLRAPYREHAEAFARWIPPCADLPDQYFDRWERILRHPLEDASRGSYRLCPEAWFAESRAWLQGSRASVSRSHHAGWLVHADDRAFVWTLASVSGGSGVLGADVDRYWHALLNVDGAPDPVSPFQRRWLRRHSYARWQAAGPAGAGSLYGFCHHAGAALVPPWTGGPRLLDHWRAMYFDLVLILLYLRVGCFRFSLELSRVSGRLLDRDPTGDARLSALRESFAWFTNLYRFPTLSNQQQGLEMYELARRRLDVDELFTEVETEIRTTDEFVGGREQQQINRGGSRLNRIAIVGLAVALSLALYEIGGALREATPADLSGAAWSLVVLEWLSMTTLAVTLGAVLWAVSWLAGTPPVVRAWRALTRGLGRLGLDVILGAGRRVRRAVSAAARLLGIRVRSGR